MARGRRRWARWAVLGAFGGSVLVSAAVLLLAVLNALNAFNPMMWMFVARFDVRNDTGEALRLTPLGMLGPDFKMVLPQFSYAVPTIPAFSETDLPVGPGETVTVLYNMDDIQLSELVWRRPDGSLRVQVVDPEAATSCCTFPEQRLYTLDSPDGLPGPDPLAREAVRRHRSLWACLLVPLPVILLPRPLWRLQKRLGGAATA